MIERGSLLAFEAGFDKCGTGDCPAGYHATAFASTETISSRRKRLAASVGSQHSGSGHQQRTRRGQDGINATGQRHLTLPAFDAFTTQVNRGQRGRAPGAHRRGAEETYQALRSNIAAVLRGAKQLLWLQLAAAALAVGGTGYAAFQLGPVLAERDSMQVRVLEGEVEVQGLEVRLRNAVGVEDARTRELRGARLTANARQHPP